MRGRMARGDRENPARKRRLWLRPAVPDSGIGQDECRAGARTQKPYQPPGTGTRRACGAAAAAASCAASKALGVKQRTPYERAKTALRPRVCIHLVAATL